MTDSQKSRILHELHIRGFRVEAWDELDQIHPNDAFDMMNQNNHELLYKQLKHLTA